MCLPRLKMVDAFTTSRPPYLYQLTVPILTRYPRIKQQNSSVLIQEVQVGVVQQPAPLCSGKFGRKACRHQTG